MQMRRRSFALVLSLGLTLAACGGQTSRLITVQTGGSGGPIKLEVANSTGAPINSVFMAKHDRVKAALRHDSSGQETEGEQVWGGDLLDKAIPAGVRLPVPVAEPGIWDIKATDADGRYQHIASVKLQAGGQYILELYDSNWRP